MTALMNLDTVTVKPSVTTHISGMEEYKKMYKESIYSPETFFKDVQLVK